MSDRIFSEYLEDILDAIAKIRQFIGEMDYDAFSKDEKTSFAVVRALEIIGEASKHIPEEVRTFHSDLPWREMAGIRDKLIHDYFGVNLSVVWKTVKQDLPALEPQIRSILEEAEGL
jgi:uncharacterized protein with HEPN domain